MASAQRTDARRAREEGIRLEHLVSECVADRFGDTQLPDPSDQRGDRQNTDFNLTLNSRQDETVNPDTNVIRLVSEVPGAPTSCVRVQIRQAAAQTRGILCARTLGTPCASCLMVRPPGQLQTWELAPPPTAVSDEEALP